MNKGPKSPYCIYYDDRRTQSTIFVRMEISHMQFPWTYGLGVSKQNDAFLWAHKM
jgi:hypothetical protein